MDTGSDNITELDDLSIYKKERTNLLDSFDASESEDNRLGSKSHINLENTSESGDQTDDQDGQQGFNRAYEIDRNIHEAIEVGNSSVSALIAPHETDEERSGTDLESQSTVHRLTPKERIFNVLYHLVPIKQTYERINNGITTGRMQTNSRGRFIGQGTDGVFRNLMAKPDTEGERYTNEEHPPTYEEAAADCTPEYWESSVIAPMYEDEVFVEGLPVGNIANFVWNCLVTVAFQFVGFVLCYLLHTSHAAKHGSRAGLGITVILYGYQLVPSNFGHSDKMPQRYEPQSPNDIDIEKSSAISGNLDNYNSGFEQSDSSVSTSNAPYFAFGLIALGLLIIFKSLVDYYRLKQTEKIILSPPTNNETSNNSITESTEMEEGEDV